MNKEKWVDFGILDLRHVHIDMQSCMKPATMASHRQPLVNHEVSTIRGGHSREKESLTTPHTAVKTADSTFYARR